MKRGIRKPKGYTPGDPRLNFYIATHDVPGNKLVIGEAAKFKDDCVFLAKMLGWKLVKTGGVYAFQDVGPNDNLMKEYGWSKRYALEFQKDMCLAICAEVLLAIETHDGEFLDDLKRLCVAIDTHDLLKSWLIITHFENFYVGAPQTRFFSAKDLCREAIRTGQVSSISEREMHEICGRLGIKLRSIRGRKKGN